MSKAKKNLAANRDLTNEELTTALGTKRDELFRLQLGTHTNQVTSTAELTTKRREIAQILTVLNNRKNGIEQQGKKA